MTWFGHLNGPVPAGYSWYSYAYGVSGNGTVVGGFVSLDGVFGGPAYYDKAWSWKAGTFTPLPFSSARYISPNSRIIQGVHYNEGMQVFPEVSRRWELNDENEVVVTASSHGPVIKLDDGIPKPIPNKTAYLNASGIWHEVGWEDPNNFGNYRVHGVSTDGKTFVGTKYIGVRPNQTLRATIWTEQTETILPLPAGFDEFFSVDMEALAVSGDGTKVVGYANVVYSAANEEANDYYAWMWTAADGMRNLQEVAVAVGITWDDNWFPNQATAISSDGRYIAGWGELDGAHREPWLMSLVPSVEIEVNSIADRPLAANATSCETGEFISNGQPECTLRSAIQAVNAGIGSLITFDIPGGGIPVIAVTNSLPAITKTVQIDGTTQSAGRVEIRGGGLDITGLTLTADDNEIRGLVMNGFVGDNSSCIRLQGGQNNSIFGNFLGTNSSGTSSVATTYGLSIFNSNGNQIGNAEAGGANVFGSELGIGLRGNNNKIQGNRIGVGLDNSLLACEFGVGVVSGDTNLIGGADNLKNYIAASSTEVAVNPEAPVSALTITGNRVGLNGTGTLAHGGEGAAIIAVAPPTIPVTGLIISDNKIAGGAPEIWLAGGGVNGAVITNNRIGLTFDTPEALPGFAGEENRHMGIRLDNSSNITISGNTIVGHDFNLVVSGENQYEVVGEDYQFKLPGSELDPRPPGGSSSDVILDGNSIGLSGNVKLPGAVQEFGVTVFGNARTVTLRNNIIGGHSDSEVRLKNGESHSLTGNFIGTATGADYGSQQGILINDANQVTIGPTGAESPNVIGRNASAGIRIKVRRKEHRFSPTASAPMPPPRRCGRTAWAFPWKTSRRMILRIRKSRTTSSQAAPPTEFMSGLAELPSFRITSSVGISAAKRCRIKLVSSWRKA
ncbi:MAG: hypothetical protein R3F19_34220 [Verrucomicrobiales bacterium]